MFEWQKHSHDTTDVPHYRDLLDFVNLRAQASESSVPESTRKITSGEARKNFTPGKSFASFVASATTPGNDLCVLCKPSRHPLYTCVKFKSLPHDQKRSTVREHSLCVNCLKPGHFHKQCKSSHRCRECQKPHHSLLHVEPQSDSSVPTPDPGTQVAAHTATGLKSNLLLMTCQVSASSLDRTSIVQTRALLDSASSASSISERLAKSLHLPRSRHPTKISGITGLSCNTSHFVTSFYVSPTHNPARFLQ